MNRIIVRVWVVGYNTMEIKELNIKDHAKNIQNSPYLESPETVPCTFTSITL